jgi:hypothetical protein
MKFAPKVHEAKRKLLSFLIERKEGGKMICAYGAPGKGNTLLNYCGIGTDFLDFTVDRNPYKHGRFTPGSISNRGVGLMKFHRLSLICHGTGRNRLPVALPTSNGLPADVRLRGSGD